VIFYVYEAEHAQNCLPAGVGGLFPGLAKLASLAKFTGLQNRGGNIMSGIKILNLYESEKHCDGIELELLSDEKLKVTVRGIDIIVSWNPSKPKQNYLNVLRVLKSLNIKLTNQEYAEILRQIIEILQQHVLAEAIKELEGSE